MVDEDVQTWTILHIAMISGVSWSFAVSMYLEERYKVFGHRILAVFAAIVSSILCGVYYIWFWIVGSYFAASIFLIFPGLVGGKYSGAIIDIACVIWETILSVLASQIIYTLISKLVRTVMVRVSQQPDRH